MSRSVFLIILLGLTLRSALAADLPQPNGFDDHLKAAEVFFQQDKLTEAFAEIQAAGKADPSRYEAPALAALCLVKSGHPTEARQALEDARKLASADKQSKLDAIAKLIDSAAPAALKVKPLAPPSATQTLTGDDRRKFDVLMLIIEDADKATTIDERSKNLQEFMDKSQDFVKDQPGSLQIWTLRAAAALELNQSKAGWEAGQQMLRLKAGDLDDPKIRKVLAMLDRKGWLSADPPVDPAVLAQKANDKFYAEKLAGKSWVWTDPDGRATDTITFSNDRTYTQVMIGQDWRDASDGVVIAIDSASGSFKAVVASPGTSPWTRKGYTCEWQYDIDTNGRQRIYTNSVSIYYLQP
jgi:hypothetical protein